MFRMYGIYMGNVGIYDPMLRKQLLQDVPQNLAHIYTLLLQSLRRFVPLLQATFPYGHAYPTE